MTYPNTKEIESSQYIQRVLANRLSVDVGFPMIRPKAPNENWSGYHRKK